MLCTTPLQVRARLEDAKKRKQGGESSAADFAPDGEFRSCGEGDACTRDTLDCLVVLPDSCCADAATGVHCSRVLCA